MSQSEIIFRAAPGSPCDVCGSESSGCSRLADGARFCRGTPLDTQAFTKLKDTNNAGFAVYRRTEETSAGKRSKGRKAKSLPSLPPAPPVAPAEPTTKPKPEIDWAERCARFADAEHFPPERRSQLAEQLGVPVEAIAELPGVGVNGYDGLGANDVNATFPERDEFGAVVGLTERRPHSKPKHYFHPGGSRGLTIPRFALDTLKLVFVVEGATDTLALCGAGIDAIGRPGAEGKTALLAAWLGGLPSDTEVIVVGENDEKADGKTPGRDGAIKVARELTKALGREVRWTLPPVGSKDVREWLQSNTSSRDRTEWQRAGSELRQLLIDAANPVPVDAAATPTTDQTGTDELPDDPARWDRTPDNAKRIASGFLTTLSKPDEPLKLRFWRSEFYLWERGAYRNIDVVDLRSRLINFVEQDAEHVYSLELSAWNRKSSDGRGPAPKIRNTTIALVKNIMQAFEGLTWLDSHIEAPSWINGSTGPDPRDLVSCANGIVNTRTGELLPPTPDYFTHAATSFGFDPQAPRAERWGQFLVDIWGETPEQIDSLQEWFGYLLTADTSMQKLLFLLGPPRAGKGTIGRVIEELVGRRNAISPKLSSLTTNFGLAPLLNKTVGIVSDLRLSESIDVHTVVENLLSITGEDTFTVDRKFLSVVTAKLPTRLVVMSNELPRLGDTSGAIYTRMILLRLTKSFLGKEDSGLTDRLLQELPAVFNWSIDGLKRLRERGRFVQPEFGSPLIQQMKDVGSPVGAFVRECCVVGVEEKVVISELYDKWKTWCKDNGRKDAGTIQVFGRNLVGTVSELTVRKLGGHRSTDRRKYYFGIRIRDEFEGDLDDDYELRPQSRPECVTDLECYEDAKNDYKKQYQTDIFSIASPASPINTEIPPIHAQAPAHTPTPAHPPTHTHEPHPRNYGDAGDANNCQNEYATIPSTEQGSAAPSHWGRNGAAVGDAADDGDDLYASLKMDFTELPCGSGMETVSLSGVTYHIVTPELMAQFESHEDEIAQSPPANRKEFLDGMARIWAYVSRRYTLGQIATARRKRENSIKSELVTT